MAKWVYKFYEGSTAVRNLLGDKGCNLAEMTNLGMPIPQGFAIATETYIEYYNCDKQTSQKIQDQILRVATWLEGTNGKKFGDTGDPLLASVRSGARASMSSMTDTILNPGPNDAAVERFAEETNNPRFVYGSYRRLTQMYSDVVMEISKSYFEKITDEMKEAKGTHFDTDLTVDDLEELAARSKVVHKDTMNGEELLQNPTEQLIGTVKTVFRLQNNSHAIVYRRMDGVPGDQDIVTNVQTVVFGNKGETSGAGIALTRSLSTGTKGIYGEYLINAQGEDVVAGVRTPQPISRLVEDLPECYKEFMDLAIKLENHSRDIQDMGFTVEEGELYFLQTHNGKRAVPTAIRIACDLVDEDMIALEEAVCRIEAKSLDQLLHPTFIPEALKAGEVIGSVFPAPPGAVADRVYFIADGIKGAGRGGRSERATLVHLETFPEDIEGIRAVQGVPTVRGDMASHAAIVIRGMRTCCVFGCGEIRTDEEARVLELGGHILHEGDHISLDGSTGKIYKDDITAQEVTVSGNSERVMEWADQFRTLHVYTNTSTPADILNTVKLGTEDISLCRTKHMFFNAERIPRIRKMILSKTAEQREGALNEPISLQKGDFKAMYKAPEGKPMTVHYLDSPLREFVPTDPEDIKALTDDMGVTVEAVNAKCTELHEFNLMTGHRGYHLAATYPEIAKVQTRAVVEAAIEVKEKCGYDIVSEIMIPLVGEKKEPKYAKDVVVEAAELVKKEKNSDIQYHIGIVIEIPRAALTASKIAEEADFFLLGTNDPTQMTFSFSCDDAGKFLDSHYKVKVYESDLFARLDQEGVGQLVKMAAEKGRSTKANLKCGICDEHSRDPSSVELRHKIGPNYVSCSPFRIPVARLAAAQAALNNK